MSKNKQSTSNHLLWQISHPNSQWVNFVFGTMHTRDERVHAFLPLLNSYLQNCKVVATEFHLPDPGQLPEVVFEPVLDWWKPLTPKQQKKIIKLLDSFNLGAVDQFLLMPPLMLIQAITSELLGKEANIPFDLALAMQAKSLGLRLDGIETFEEQIGILHQIPLSKQLDQLLGLSKDVGKFKRNLKNQVRWYLQQDIQRLYKDSRKQLKSLRKLLLLRRNRIMADRMAIMCAKESHFMAIGAAHLWGGKGVLNYLRHSGFKITPITITIEEQ